MTYGLPYRTKYGQKFFQFKGTWMWLWIIFLALGPRPALPCVFMLEGWTPVSLTERARLADIVAIAKAIRTLKNERDELSNTYRAVFSLIETLKGQNILDTITPLQKPFMNQESQHRKHLIYPVSNFGDRHACYSDVTNGQEYILFLTTFEGHLSAKYDDLFGAATERTKEAEKEIKQSFDSTIKCSRHCYNGATCSRTGTCNCTAGYFGRDCRKVQCNPRCRNGGQCFQPNHCTCLAGFTGQYCQIPLCEKACVNGGTCTHPGYCSCPRGYQAPVPSVATCTFECQNGGTCVAPNVCKCLNGFSGKYCHLLSNACNRGCLNGGRCLNNGTCECPPLYHGLHCQHRKCTRRIIRKPQQVETHRPIYTRTVYPCGPLNLKICSRTKIRYQLVHRTVYKTVTECV